MMVVARASRWVPRVARFALKLWYRESSLGLPDARASVSPTRTAVAKRPTHELSCCSRPRAADSAGPPSVRASR